MPRLWLGLYLLGKNGTVTATGTHRGHAMYYDKDAETWRYTDDDSSVPDTHAARPCGHCGVPTGPDGHDPCIAGLPGVVNACCGHGTRSESYVTFSDGRTFRGFLIADD